VACVIVLASVTALLPVLAYDLADLLQPSTVLNAVVTFLTLLATLATLGVIVLVSALTASRWMTVVITFLMNLFVVLISLFAAGDWGTLLGPRVAVSPFVEFALLIQWTIGGILTAAAGTQRAILQELESTRIAFERSRQVEELKDQFITHINHEVRGPVMALQGYLQLLQAKAESATPEQRDAYVSRARRAADHLVTLVTEPSPPQAAGFEPVR
jgi:signal transduction histidine kinase